MSPDNILLRLTEDDEQSVRDIFAGLEARGLPTQFQRPHITITFAPQMDKAAIQRAAQVLPDLMPVTLQRVGAVIFGRKRKQTVAWLLEAPAELEKAAREVGALNPGGRGERWIPHLTMGLRLPRTLIPDYLGALDELTPADFTEVTAHQAVLFQPRFQKLTEFS